MEKILTHWDADGIISASKLLEVIEGELYVPEIGRWKFEAIPPEALGGTLHVLDYSIPPKDWEKVCERVEDLILIDHHVGSRPPCGKIINPALRGIEVPACSLVVSDYFKLPYDWRDAVAIAADLGDPFGNRYWEKVVRERKLDERAVLEAAALLNSCYRLLDYDCIIEYSRKLKDMSLEDLLSDERLRRNRARAKEKLEEYLSRAMCTEKVCVVRGDEGVHLFTSSLWKKLSKGNELIVLITIDEKRFRAYCKGGDRDYSEIIELLRKRGFEETGGKKHVCSVQAPLSDLERFLKVLKELRLLDELELLEPSVVEH